MAWCFCIDTLALKTALCFHILISNLEWEKVASLMQLRIVEDNVAKTVMDACGNPLPPCIVMERGEALDFWVARARPDRASAISVCFYLHFSFLFVLSSAGCIRSLAVRELEMLLSGLHTNCSFTVVAKAVSPKTVSHLPK
jgi:hypothetical protein